MTTRPFANCAGSGASTIRLGGGCDSSGTSGAGSNDSLAIWAMADEMERITAAPRPANMYFMMTLLSGWTACPTQGQAASATQSDDAGGDFDVAVHGLGVRADAVRRF